MTHIGIVFPGQGSQAVGMLAALAAAYPQVSQTFAEASEVLKLDLWQLTQQGPEAVLNDTRNTQPALLAASVAVWRVWQALTSTSSVTVVLMAGHSLGEYSALVCAGALEFTDAVALVAQRARLMQAAVPPGQGAMAAILGLDAAQVQAVCVEAQGNEVVAAVNLNTPEQIVIAGHSGAVARACQLAKSAGAKKTLPLPVSVPSHCALMRPAATQLAEYLATIPIQPPQIPIIHNASVSTTTDPERIRELLALQLYSPVRWVETMQTFVVNGVTTLIEVGPGKVLTGLNKRINPTIQTWPVSCTATLAQALKETVDGK